MATSADVETRVYGSRGVDYSANGASMLSGPYGSYDPISRLHRAIRNEIFQYQITTYEAFAFGMHIVPCQSSDRRLDYSRLAHAGYEVFKLTRFDEFDDYVTKVIARFNQEGRVEVCFLNKHFLNKRRGYVFNSFAKWIASLPIDGNPNLRDFSDPVSAFRVRLDHQISWYKASGKASRNNLLTLPNELKIKIYNYCIGPQVYPYPALRDRFHPTYSNIATGLLYANKQISQAYQWQLYEKTTWNITCWPVLEAMIRNRVDCPYPRIKKLIIAMEYDELFKGFGLTVIAPTETLSGRRGTPKTLYSSVVRNALHNMRLDSLEIDLSPALGTINNADCHRKMADLVLRTMWPHIEGQPLTITGAIKKDQKAMFESMGREAHHQREVLDAAGFDKEFVNTPMPGCRWVKEDIFEDQGSRWAGIDSDLAKDVGDLEHPARRLVEPYERFSEWAVETDRRLVCKCKHPCVRDDWVFIFDDGNDASFNQAQVVNGAQYKAEHLQPPVVDVDRLFENIFAEAQDAEDDASTTTDESSEMSINESDDESNDGSDSPSAASDDSETLADNKSDFTDGAVSLYDPIYPTDEQSACDRSADNTAADNVAATDPYFFAPRPQGDPYASLWLLESRASLESDEEVDSILDLFERQCTARSGNEVAADHVTEQPPDRSSAASPVSTVSSEEGDGVLLSDWVATRPAAEYAGPVRETAAARYTRLNNLRRILVEGVPS